MEIQKEELPEILNPKTVCFYSHFYRGFIDEHGEKVAHPLKVKALKFLKNNSIRYDKDMGCYFCDFLQGYNSRNYQLTWNKELKRWECNCQSFVTKLKKGEKPFCSHLLTLMLYFKIKNWRKV